MRGMIIGLSALAFAGLPTLAFADGNGAVTGAAGGAVAGAVVGGPVGAAVGGVAGGVIGGAASESPPSCGRPRPGRTVQYTHHDDPKQQYGRKCHETDDGLPRLKGRTPKPRLLDLGDGGSWRALSLGLRVGWALW